MKKTFVISLLSFALILTACGQQTLTKDEIESNNEQEREQEIEQKIDEDQTEEELQESDNPEMIEQIEDTVEGIPRWNKYDREIDNLVKDNYSFDHLINCSDNIEDEVKRTDNKFYFGRTVGDWGRTINDVVYDKKVKCIGWGETCSKERLQSKENQCNTLSENCSKKGGDYCAFWEGCKRNLNLEENQCNTLSENCDKEILKSEEDQIQKIINANRFNVVHGCLYDGQNKALKYNINTYFQTEYFGKKIDDAGLYVSEWFRFEDNNKLYIYLSWMWECFGCVINGPYLIIDLNSGSIEGKYSDLPYHSRLVLSPNKKVAIEVENRNEEGLVKTKFYLFDFITNKRGKLIYETLDYRGLYHPYDPSGYSIITWIDNSTVRIQLYGNDNDNYAASELEKEVIIKIDE